MLKHYLELYGYPAIALGVVFEGETILILGGFAARQGYLTLHWVILAAFVGSLSSDQAWFHLARRYGQRMLEKRPAWQGKVAWVDRLLERYGALFFAGLRFLYGLRTIAPFAVGLTHAPALRFLIFNACGAAIWATAFGSAGFAFGAVVEANLEHIKRYQAVFFALLAVVVGVVWWIRRRRALRG